METEMKAKAKKKGGCLKILGIGFLVFVGLIVAIAIFSGGEDVADPVTDQPMEETTASNDADTTETEQGAVEEEAEDDGVPLEFKNALAQAQTYSDMMHMSKAGVFEQLTSEYGGQFPEDAAQYAIDNVKADWNANALKKAESYSDDMYMSKAAIYDQLISEHGEKFLEAEARYAIDNIQADWNANALEKAKSYQEDMSMSKEAIREQLVSEYGEQFTQEEADYAVSNLQ